MLMTACVLISTLDEFDTTAVITSQIKDMLKEDPTPEGHLGSMNRDKESFKRVFEGAMLRWVSGELDRPGTETWKEFTARVEGALKRIMEEQGNGRNIFVFTSGGPIAASLQNFLSITSEAAIRLNWQVVNTSFTKYMYNKERVTMAGFNCISHLEMEKDRVELISYR